MSATGKLSRRERQIMDILYQHGKAAASQVLEAMEDAPSYSAVRALLRILEDKGHVRHEESAGKYIFIPTMHRDKAKKSAIRHLVQTFFDGSRARAAAALLTVAPQQFSEEELDELEGLIRKARKGDRGEL